MDQISIESSESSSCSTVSYQGSDGYISDGEDPFFEAVEPDSDQEKEEYEFGDLETTNPRKPAHLNQADLQLKKKKKEQEALYKEIMNELKFGRNTALLLNKHPLVPTYTEIIAVLKLIKQRFPQTSINKIVQQLYSQLIQKPKEAERLRKIRQHQRQCPKPATIPHPSETQQWNAWVAKRKVAAEAFVEYGYGISLMRKLIYNNSVLMEIDLTTYDDIIQKLLRDAYSRLQRFLRKKCHKKVIKLSSPVEEKILIGLLKDCTKKAHKFDSYEVRNFSKLIKPTYIKDRKFRLSKRIASRIYHTCKSVIASKKMSMGQLSLDNPESQIYNNDKGKWTEQMISSAVSLFMQEASLNSVRETMLSMAGVDSSLLDIRNIKYHISNKVKQAVKIISSYREQISNQDESSIKDMVEIDNHKLNDIINHQEANYVRVLLCEVYLARQPTVALINQAVLAVNEFLLKMENEKMLQELRRADDASQQSVSRRRRRSKKG